MTGDQTQRWMDAQHRASLPAARRGDGHRGRPDLASTVALAAVVGVLACGPADGPRGGMGTSVEPPLRRGCNPLSGAAGEDCFTPYPSAFYMDRGAGMGGQLRIPADVLPTSGSGVAIDPARLARRDGFSAATPMLAYFPTRLSAANLPTAGRVGMSLLPDSPVQVFAYDTGDRVPILAELDQNAGDGQRQALVIMPQVRLRPATRYVVALRGLQTTGGLAVAALSGFAALRDGRLDPGSVRDGERARFEEIFQFLAAQGVPRAGLQLAWDFVTGSDDAIVGRLTRMRDRALAQPSRLGGTPLITIDKVIDRPPGQDGILRQVRGRLAAPSFLTDDSDGRLWRGANGEPQLRGFGQFPLTIHVPTCAERTMGPLPVLFVGHTLFASGQSDLETQPLRELAGRLCMIQVATDWIGLSAADRSGIPSRLQSDPNQLLQVTDRLHQALINHAWLARVTAEGALDALPDLRLGGRPIVDSKRVYYYGVSAGATLGLPLLALSPHLSRAALVVPGGFWSQLVWRGSALRPFVDLLAAGFPDPLDRQLIIAIGQAQWDYVDAATYAPHVVRDPLPGSGPPKRVLLQEGIGDAQVTNLATRAVVRTLGLSLLGLPTEAVFGVGQILSMADSAYVQFDIGQMPRPGDSNVPPSRDNAVHRAIPRLDAAKAQVELFLREDGRVVDTCAPRPCSFPAPAP